MWSAGPVFLAIRLVWALEPRLCSLFVPGLAVESSASAETRKRARCCDHAAQKIYDQIDIRLFFRYVLEAVPDALYLAVFNDANELFVLPMMHL